MTDEAADMTYSSVEANKEYDNSEETDCDLKCKFLQTMHVRLSIISKNV